MLLYITEIRGICSTSKIKYTGKYLKTVSTGIKINFQPVKKKIRKEIVNTSNMFFNEEEKTPHNL